jgi:tRNA threonylcarbamoyladenosine biosynthesis protein TsaE
MTPIGSRVGRPEENRGTARVTRSEDETADVARALASTLKAGDVLLLSGNLGAGKTAFVRGLAAGLEIEPDEVSSPTFTLVHEYRGGRLVLYHVDLYRLQQAATADLGLEELGVRDGVVAIEWPDRLSHGMFAAIEINIEIVDAETRNIRIMPAKAGPYDDTTG